MLLHGFGASHATWDPLVPVISQHARTLAYDLPGHGRSFGWPDAGPARQAAHSILADMDGRDRGQVHLVGHSMGGAIATLMALAAPERVASLTLLAPGGIGEQINGPLLRRYAAAATKPEILACLTAMSGPGHIVPEDVVSACLDMRKQPGQTQKLTEIAAAITKDGRQGVIPHARLAELTMPVAVLWGDCDPVLPAMQADSLPSHFLLRRVPDAGHMLISESPGQVAEIVRLNMQRAKG